MKKKSIMMISILIVTILSMNSLSTPIISKEMQTKEQPINNQLLNQILSKFLQAIEWMRNIVQKISTLSIFTNIYNQLQHILSNKEVLKNPTIIQQIPSLSGIPIEITKTDNLNENTIVPFGGIINYTIVIKNPEINPAQTQVLVIDELPDEVSYISSITPGLTYNPDDHIAYITYPSMEPNETKTIEITVQVDLDNNHSCMINNTASVSSSIPLENTAYERTAIGTQHFDPLIVQINDDPDQIKEPTQDHPSFINYTINVTNQNNHDVHNVTIRNILSNHVTFQNASNNITIYNNNGETNIFWGFDTINSQSSKESWINVSANIGTPPLTEIFTRVNVSCNETELEGYANETTIVEENNPPTTTYKIGNPNYFENDKYFISENTPIHLNASDNPEYWTGVKKITYEIWQNQILLYTTTILDNSEEDSNKQKGYINHTLNLENVYNTTMIFYAYDTFNKEIIDNDNIIHFEEIELTPIIDLIIGEPKINCFYEINGKCFDAISAETPLTIHATGVYSSTGFGELDHLNIEIYHGELYGEWELQQSYTIYDNDDNDEDPMDNSIIYHIDLNENCWYQIDYWSVDKLGNTNPDNGQIKTKDLFVDAQGPESTYWFNGPEYHDPFHWITNETTCHIMSYDEGCNNQGIGVHNIEYWLLKKITPNQWYEVQRETIMDNQEFDYDSTQGIIRIQTQIQENGEYYLYHQSTDLLQNKGTIYKKHLIVDTEKPETSLTVHNPKCFYNDDEDEFVYCVTTHTPIDIHSIDHQHPYAVGIYYFEYKIEQYNTTIKHEQIYDTNHQLITFNEQGPHTLKYRAIDFLNHQEPWNIQQFIVDDQKPTISLELEGPHVNDSIFPDYWVRSNTTIIIDGENQGGCPNWEIFYQIDDQPPVYITDPDDRPHTVHFPDECKYTLTIEAYDCLNNQNSMLKQFYVDNTAPEFHIIKPHNGIYSKGQTFHATFYANDISQYTPPCHEDHAVGIPNNSMGEAWIIDIEPSFEICKLECNEFKYDTASHEYNGDITIPDDCPIANGSAFLISGAQDALLNGKHHIKNMIEYYYYLLGPDSSFFKDYINTLRDNQQLIDIVIDNSNQNDPEPGAPTVLILHPSHNDNITDDTLHVMVNASDFETTTDELHVQLQINIPNTHSYIKTMIHNETSNHFELDIDINYIQNNTEINLLAYATDTDNKTGISSPVYCRIINQVYYSKWMILGWNEIQFPSFITNTSLNYAFQSINESFYIIFELETGDYYIKNQDFNTLEYITPGNTYWVKMIQDDALYLNEG